MTDDLAEQLLTHAIGDYLVQNHWMATEKTRGHLPAAVHAATYAIPFLRHTRSPWRLGIIGGTHFVIDRWRLARHVVWLKNQVAPAEHRPGHTPTGFPDGTPDFLAVWLLIISDNLCHVLINRAALAWRSDR
jgi:hypothetical protein